MSDTPGRKPTHRACFMEEYKDRDGQPKTKFITICSVWESEKGNFIINIPKGMLLTGKIILLPNKEDENKTSEGLGNHAFPETDDSEMPF